MNERKEVPLNPVLIQLADRVTIPLLARAWVGAGYWLYQKWFFKQTQSATPDSQSRWSDI